MKYIKTTFTTGNWVNKADIENGTTAEIVSETEPQPSQFKNKDGSSKTQDVAKVLFKGFSEPVNVSINRTSINGLIDAFGEDSINWKNKTLRVEKEKERVGGKAVVTLYLIPKGYVRTDDESGFAVISKEEEDIPVIEDSEEDEINKDL